jgi:flagella basal body P-ring formation protein FlgA
MSLRPGMVLRTSHLQLPVLVKRNEEVELIARGKNFIVKAKGVALENGRLGEVIRVRNKDSQKVVFAKVVGERLVEVSY